MQQQQQQPQQPFYEEVGKGFAQHYYQVLQANKLGIANLYKNSSCMSFEGSQMQGREAIMNKLNSLTYQSVEYVITTIDSQPVVGVDGDAAVFVTTMGRLKTDQDPPQSFVQSFLLRNEKGEYYIANETFRIVLHNQS